VVILDHAISTYAEFFGLRSKSYKTWPHLSCIALSDPCCQAACLWASALLCLLSVSAVSSLSAKLRSFFSRKPRRLPVCSNRSHLLVLELDLLEFGHGQSGWCCSVKLSIVVTLLQYLVTRLCCWFIAGWTRIRRCKRWSGKSINDCVYTVSIAFDARCKKHDNSTLS